MEAALEVEELRARGMLAEYDHPAFGSVRSVGLPLALGGFAPDYRRGPAMGADGLTVLRSAGFSDEEIDGLRAAGAFGTGGSTDDAAEPG